MEVSLRLKLQAEQYDKVIANQSILIQQYEKDLRQKTD